MRKINRIIIHYLGPGSGKGLDAKGWVSRIRGWHRGKGYRDIGYHRVVAMDGSRAQGRPDAEVGAHAYIEGNPGSIGIVACIGVDDGKPPENLLVALAKEIADVAEEHGIPLDRAHVIGHNEVGGEGGQTACPGQLSPLLGNLVERARKVNEPAVVVNGTQVGTGFNVDGSVFVPLRLVAEALGANVTWDNKKKVASIVKRKED